MKVKITSDRHNIKKAIILRKTFIFSSGLVSRKSIKNPESLLRVLFGIKTFTFKFAWFNPFT